MKTQLKMLASALGITLLGAAAQSHAAFIRATTPSTSWDWTRPDNVASATSTLTTFQEWDGFTSPSGPNLATTIVNPNGVSNAFDAASPADGAFNAGTDIYSFSASLNPVLTIPEFSISGHDLNVLLQAQSYGSDINTSDIQVIYTDKTGTHTVAANSLPNFSYTQEYLSQSNAGFGLSDQVDHAWTFTVPDTSLLTINLGWDATSSALQGLSVDTQSFAAVPEPISMVAFIASGCLLLGRRRSTRGNHAAA